MKLTFSARKVVFSYLGLWGLWDGEWAARVDVNTCAYGSSVTGHAGLLSTLDSPKAGKGLRTPDNSQTRCTSGGVQAR